MSNNVIPISQARAPAAMRQRLQQGVATNRNFADGVRDAFPMLSIKGKVFRLRVDGVETPFIDQQTRQVIPALDVVLANASRLISKAYYIRGFVDDGDFLPPDCWSLDGVRPDPSVANKVSPTCANCPKNAFGSAPARNPEEGKRGGKACSDARRIAVLMPSQLQKPDKDPLVFLMRVPATSLKSLKAYAQMLERNGWEPAACVTRLSFDYNEAYPKLVFNFVDALTDQEYAQVVQIAESPSTASMLEAPDFDTGVPANPTPNANLEQRVRQAEPGLQDPSILGGQQAGAQPAQQQQEPPMRQGVQAQGSLADILQGQPAHAESLAPGAAGIFKPQTQAADPIIELPTGERFNTATGEFLPVGEPKVEMPSFDPATIALPDGRFFHQPSGKFVVGPEVGAPEIGKGPTEPPKRTRTRTKKDPAPAAATPEAGQQAAPEAAAPAGEQPPAAANGNGAAAAGPAILPASAALNDILKSVLPK